jgi:hypothetical protein
MHELVVFLFQEQMPYCLISHYLCLTGASQQFAFIVLTTHENNYTLNLLGILLF